MSDGLSFATVVETSGFDEGMKHIEEGIRNASTTVEGYGERIQSILDYEPKIDIEFITNMNQTEQQIKEAYAEIDATVAINQQHIAELSQEYNRLTGEINKYRNVPQKKDEVQQWIDQRKEIKENIALRKDIIAKVQEYTAVVKENEKALKKQNNTQTSVKAQMRAVMAEMASLRNEAQKAGITIDESTGRYRELAEELGRLKDIQGDVQTQAKILSNDENQFQGIISGLTGISGGFSAAQGAMALFGTENENLQKVMTQLQAVMAITIGLQQVQQMLNKDSAFRLVTLNSLRSLWNKLIGESNSVQAAENSQKSTNIALTEEQTIAEEQNTVAEEANAAARTANSKATQAGVAGTVADTKATQAATASQNAHTGAMAAGTLATKGLTLATKLLKVALISTGIGALIVAVGELVSWITELINKEDDAVKHAKALNEVEEEAAKTYIQEKVALEDNIKACQNFSGTKEQEKKKVDELNSKYGEALGYYDSLEQWEKVLTQRGPAYCEMLRMKAVQQGLLNKYVEAYVEALAVAHKAENGEFDRGWYNPARWFGDSNEERRANMIKEAEKEAEYWKEAMEKQKSDLEKFQKENNFDEIHIAPKSASSSSKSSGASFDPKEAARKEKEALQQYSEAVKQFIKETNKEIEQANTDSMAEGLQKEIRSINNRTQELTEQWKQHFLALAQERKDYEKAYYLAQKGHTLEGWEASDRGKMSTQQYLDEMLNAPGNEKMNEQYYDRLAQITHQGEQQILDIKQSYQDKLIEEYGSDLDKEELLQKKWYEKINKIRADLSQTDMKPEEIEKFMQQVYKAMDKEFDEMGLSQLKKSINWEEVFGNMDSLATSSLESLREKLQASLKTISSPEAAKTITDALKNIDKELAERNPFENLKNSLTNLVSSDKAVRVAQEAYNNALEKGNALEIKAAENTLNAAKNVKQKALAEATQAMQASVAKVSEYMGIATTLTSTLGELGVELPEQLTGFLDGMGQVLDGLSSINLTNPVSIITGGISAIGGLIKGIGSLFNNDAKHQRNIEKLQERIDALQKSYDKLGDSVEDYYSKDASKMIEQQNTLLKQQKVLIQNQIREEQAKKDTDNNKIKEWREQIEEINDLIEENKQAAIDAIFGEELKSSIENFADAYAEAWANNEDRAKSAKDVVKKLMQQMVQESIKAAIQSSNKMEDIRKKLQQFYTDNVLSDWEQDYIYQMAQSLQDELDRQFGWASDLLGGDESEREGTSKGIATASQDSVDENNARLTTIQGHTYTLVQLMQEHNATSNAILEKVTGIEENTSETNNRLNELDKKAKRMADTLDNIQTGGLKLK